jgi:small subunit ribosomal protein S3
MIEKNFVAQNVKEFEIAEFVEKNLERAGISAVKMQRTPLGEKIVIFTSRPGLVVGRNGESIRKLTKSLKKKFNLENPQIEISEVSSINLDPQIVAEKIATSLEKYGIQRFKGIMHKAMEDVMLSGAMGVEIIVSGKIPSSRAKSWRVYDGYLKKCGNIGLEEVKKAMNKAEMKTGTVGIKVSIMPPDVILPDNMKLIEQTDAASDKKETAVAAKEEPKEKRAPKRPPKKRREAEYKKE